MGNSNEKLTMKGTKRTNLGKHRVFWMWAFIFCLVAVLASCSQPEAESAPGDWHGVDPIFREYYRYLGETKVMGPAISPVSQEGGVLVQYVEAGKLVFDLNAPPRYRFRLSPLGESMGLVEPPIPPISDSDPYYINGHTIYHDFVPMYEKLGGLNVVGRPTTEMKYNPARRRYEQYFENLGFYRLEGSGEVRLLAYGVWACDQGCRKENTPLNATIDFYRQIDPTFAPFVSRLGSDFTGFPLTEAYIGRDGKWEQVFENLVLTANAPNDPSSVSLRQLSKEIGILSELPRPYSNSPDKYFYELDGNKGYEIPINSWNYITQRGGLALFGAPITQQSLLNNVVFHQCFVNICLIYDPRSSEASRVRPESLGYTYRQLYYKDSGSSGFSLEMRSTDTEALNLRVWERFPVIASTQQQEIGVIVLRGNRPVSNVAPILTLTLLDGSRRSIQLSATGQDGQTRSQVPTITAPNGTLILYQVCLPEQGQENLCVGDSFVIWNYP